MKNTKYFWRAGTILSAWFLLVIIGYAQENKTSVFAVNPIRDGGAREMPPLKGFVVKAKKKFAFPPGTVPLNFPNGNLDDVARGWPSGGWGQFDPSSFAASVALFNYENAGITMKPADYAKAAGMPLGEYDFVIQKTGSCLTLWQGVSSGPRVELIEGEAPGKTNLLRLHDTPRTLLRTPDFEIPINKPYFVSYWVRTTTQCLGLLWYDVSHDTRTGTVEYEYLSMTDTHGEWMRVGFYFEGRPDIAKAHVIYLPPDQGKQFDLAGFEVRSVTDAEMAGAYAADRANYPPNVTSPQPGDGEYLGLSKAKLADKAGVPGRPFVVWAIGSSWTNGLGRGEVLREMVHKVYPNAPEIVYRIRMGSGAPYDDVRGWGMTGVVKDQPDLVISYTGGTPEGLEAMLKSIRSQTTADIIIPSLHFLRNDPLTPENIDPKELQALRDVCTKYGAQFVENRKELAEWLKVNHKNAVDLRNGAGDVHENALGILLTNENIWRHLLAPIGTNEVPTDRERMINLLGAFKNSTGTGISFSGDWKIDGDFLVSNSPEAAITFDFVGNRLDVLGQTIPGGGSLNATVDGKPLDQLDAFSVSIIQQPDTNHAHGTDPGYPRSSGGSQATGPHGISLGKNIVPQDWKFEMIDNVGHFKLTGTVTGPDGEGSVLHPFTSTSGQIIMDPKLWRYGNMAWFGHPEQFSNTVGDYWPFTVMREVSGPISFNSPTQEPLDRTLFKLAPNSEHKVVLTVSGGPVRIKAIVAYKPPIL